MIVIDTHVFLWHALDDPRLDPRAKELMDGDRSQVLLPSVCIWEAALLAQRGRIRLLTDDPGAELRNYARISGFSESALTHEIALLSRTLDFEHEDPADRFIAATAFSTGSSLATSDQRLRRLSWIQLAY